MTLFRRNTPDLTQHQLRQRHWARVHIAADRSEPVFIPDRRPAERHFR